MTKITKKPKKGIENKVFNYEEKSVLDKTVTKDMDFSLLKTVMNKLPIPKIVPPKFENLQYVESIILFKLKVVMLYCCNVEDEFAAGIFTHEKEHLQRYKDILDNIMNFMIILTESDSFYRHRAQYFITMMRSDMLLNHYFRLINEHGLTEKWDGRVLNIRLSPDSFFRGGAPAASKEMAGPFSHLEEEIKKRGSNFLSLEPPKDKKNEKKV